MVLGLLQRRRAVIDLNNLCVGRKCKDETNGPLLVQYAYHTKAFRRGKVELNGLSNTDILRGHASSQFKEGFDIILPYKKGSFGWKIFHDLPIMKMKIYEDNLDMLQYELALIGESAKEIKSPAQVLQMVHSILDTVSEMRKKVEIIPSEMPIIPVPIKEKE